MKQNRTLRALNTRSRDFIGVFEGFRLRYAVFAPVFGTSAPIYGDSARVYGNFARIYGNFARVYGNFARVNGNFARIYGNFARVYGDFARVYGNFARVYGNFARVREDLAGARGAFATCTWPLSGCREEIYASSDLLGPQATRPQTRRIGAQSFSCSFSRFALIAGEGARGPSNNFRRAIREVVFRNQPSRF